MAPSGQGKKYLICLRSILSKEYLILNKFIKFIGFEEKSIETWDRYHLTSKDMVNFEPLL